MEPNLAFVREILARIYLPPFIYLYSIMEYSPSSQAMVGIFNVPTSQENRYTAEPLSYVSATERHSCVNQLAYALTALQVRDRVAGFARLDIESFKSLSQGLQMWNTEEHFVHNRVLPRNTEFEIGMRITRSRISQHGLSVVEVDIHGSISGYVHFAVELR